MSARHQEQSIAAAAIPYATDASRLDAVRRRDRLADGQFLYAVSTTGVFCHPSCAARPARVENISFHDTREAAERAGFRACRRCRPDLPPKPEREAALVAAACRRIETADNPPDLSTLAGEAGMSAAHFHRLFKRVAGVTPKAYADARRQARVKQGLAAGESVTGALYDAGYGSSGRFYEAADAMLGMTPGAWRRGGAGERIVHACGRSRLGAVLVAASGRGICAILLGDDPAALSADLAARFPRAELAPAEPGFARVVAEVVALVDDPAEAPALSLPLDIRGTAFQRRVWEALRTIPAGTTASYGAIAGGLGMPRAVRAVASACAANALAVAVPCHRAVAADGGLAGYRWGLARKRSLLETERR